MRNIIVSGMDRVGKSYLCDKLVKKYGLNVSRLYIAQIKSKVGLEKRKNYNTGEGKSKIPNCPPEKEEAIMDAFRYFNLI